MFAEEIFNMYLAYVAHLGCTGISYYPFSLRYNECISKNLTLMWVWCLLMRLGIISVIKLDSLSQRFSEKINYAHF